MDGLKRPDLSRERSALRAPELASTPPGFPEWIGTASGGSAAHGRGSVEERIRPFRSSNPALSAPLAFSSVHRTVRTRKRAAPWRGRPVGPDTWYEVRTTSVALRCHRLVPRPIHRSHADLEGPSGEVHRALRAGQDLRRPAVRRA